VVWSLIGNTPKATMGAANTVAGLRAATARLVAALYREVGEALLDAANNSSNVSLSARQNLRQIVNGGAFVGRS